MILRVLRDIARYDLNAATDAASTAWDQVVEDAAAVTDADTASIDAAWDDFAAAVAGDSPADAPTSAS